MIMTFKRIVRKAIFTESFSNLVTDNELNFPESGIVVIYGPNGTGKSSLANVLANKPETEFTLVFDGKEYKSKDANNLFHVINDQNERNIIQGSTEDFILGDNIRREYELKQAIKKDFDEIFSLKLIPQLRNVFGIVKKNSALIEKIQDEEIKKFINDLANVKSKGSKIDHSKFLSYIESLNLKKIKDYDEKKFTFLVRDFNSDTSIIRKIQEVAEKNIAISNVLVKVEENLDAITLLEKYYYLHECVVCDSVIERMTLLEKKHRDKDLFYDRLDDETKSVLRLVHDSIGEHDPFLIKAAITEASVSGKPDKIEELLIEFEVYFDIVNSKINNLFAGCLEGLDLLSNQKEYDTIISEKPELTNEDVLFIEKFVNDCIDKKIELQRDAEGNLELLLGQKKFLNENRKDLSLSNGEQNFISIAFELLKAKKVEAQVIVLDDPISSFDSIYKNKISYAIIKFLAQKKQILLTHNTDLIKLLEHQRSQSFNLYILNNTNGERNGFIPISRDEQSLLLYLNALLDFLRGDVKIYIKDECKFLIAITPFMRSFSQILNKPQIKDDLTGIMHGYSTSSVNLTAMYSELFDCSFISTPYIISVENILEIDLDYWEIIDKSKYPLLNRSFVHILTYLYLRLMVEKTLVEKFKINTKRCDMLTRIIDKAFKGEDFNTIKNRVFLLSRKTLLNEFNHFDQDLNIFQPALDITDTTLQKERDDILQFLRQL